MRIDIGPDVPPIVFRSIYAWDAFAKRYVYFGVSNMGPPEHGLGYWVDGKWIATSSTVERGVPVTNHGVAEYSGDIPDGSRRHLYGIGTALSGADAHHIFKRQNEDLSIPDLAIGSCLPAPDDCLHGRLNELVIDGDFELHLANQIHLVLVAAVHFGVSLLATQALNITDREAEDLHLAQRFLDSLQPRWLDNRNNVPHETPPRLLN